MKYIIVAVSSIQWKEKLLATTTVASRGISERNRRVLTSLYRSVTGPFSVQEAADALSISIPRTHRFLAYLAGRGWLVRVCRGLYAPIPLDAINPSEWREDPWVVASKLFGPDYYIGGWTACEHWDLTEQVFRVTVVVTTKRVRGKDAEVQGFPFRIRRTTSKRSFGAKPVWRDQTRVNVSDPTRTVVDILDNPSLGGGIRHVADVVSTYFRVEHRDDKLLGEYLKRAGNRTAFKRLGYLLESLEVHAPNLLKVCEKSLSTGVGLLDPSLPGEGPIVWRWKLRVNGTVQSDGVAG